MVMQRDYSKLCLHCKSRFEPTTGTREINYLLIIILVQVFRETEVLDVILLLMLYMVQPIPRHKENRIRQLDV